MTSDFVASARTNARYGGRSGSACPLVRGYPRRSREAMRELVRSRYGPTSRVTPSPDLARPNIVAISGRLLQILPARPGVRAVLELFGGRS
jgi:hypothetical protein